MLWKEKYELGVPLIDEQHKELFKRIENFIQMVRTHEPWETKTKLVNETLDFMNAYVIEHFRDEEEYQEKIEYPEREKHSKIHNEMIDYVLQVTQEYQKGGFNEILMQQLSGKLLTWLINHVAAEDQKIAVYAIERGLTEK